MHNVMVINMGMKSIRCIIFNKNGLKLGSSAIPISTAINDKHVEQNPLEWREKAEIVMRKALADAGGCSIDYITVTTSASCLICVDEYGEPLGNALMVSDKRAEEEAEMISGMPEFNAVRANTGMEMSVSLMLPKILWIKKHRPEIFDKTAFFITPNDYLIYFLAGIYTTDYFNAVKYHYDLDSSKYPETLLGILGIPVEKFPEVKNTGELVGVIRKEISEKTGVSEDAKVVLSSYDAICSFVGSGVSDEGEASDVSGTVTVFRTFTRKKDLRKNPAIYDVPFYQENARIIGGSNNLGGGLIEWVKQCYYQKEEYPYEVMEKEAAESTLGAKGLVFLPYLLGERAPLWDNDARGVFFGLERMHTRKDMTRAVFESTGFIDMDMIEAIEKTDVNIESIRLSGGLARINLISQLKADILGRDVAVLAEFETTAAGAAMMVLLGQGVYQNLKQIAERFAVVRMIIRPDMENHRKYAHMYQLYKDTYQALKGLYVRRQEALFQIRSDREIQIENL